MYGILRFILAILVALSHLGVSFYGYNFGVSSVVIFYLLAGMVSFKLISNHYPNQPKLYYLDRLKRIFPLYLMVLLFTYFVYLFGASSYFISAKPDFISYFSNITVVPLAYFMYGGIDKFMLIPPVWSLGVELQFYLLAPFILLYFNRLLLLLVISFVVYILAITGVFHTDYFGYRLIVGVIFIFLLGAVLQNTINGDDKSKKILFVIYSVIIVLSIYLYFDGYKAPYNRETLFALVIGIPLLAFISLLKTTVVKLQAKILQLDKYLGSLSYAVFLLHFPVLWLVQIYGYSEKNIFLILSIAIIFSVVFIFLEKYFISKITH